MMMMMICLNVKCECEIRAETKYKGDRLSLTLYARKKMKKKWAPFEEKYFWLKGYLNKDNHIDFFSIDESGHLHFFVVQLNQSINRLIESNR